MLTLGIETSGREGSVALVNAGEVLGEADLSQTGRRHARTLVAELKSLLERCGKVPSDVEAVAVSIGPGSFTGLRVGVVCAKTFAYATGCRIVAVDTLQAIAANSPPDVTIVDAVIDAFRGELFLGRYHRTGNETWQRDEAVRIVSAESLFSPADAGIPLTGPGLAVLGEQLPDRRLLPENCRPPRAIAIARLGESQALAGQVDDLWKLEPFYLRKSAAEEKAERTSAV